MRARFRPGGTVLAMMAALLLAQLAAPEAQAAERPQVAALVAKATAPYMQALEAFKRAYGGPVSTHVLDFESEAVARVREERPALVLAVGVKAAKVAKELIGLPIVYCMVVDPRANGIEGESVVGVPLEIPAEEQLAQLKRLAPGVKSVGLVFNPARSGRTLGEAQSVAAGLSMKLVAEPAASSAQFPDALHAVLPKAEALWLLSDPTVVTQDTFRLMLEAAMSARLPLLTCTEEFVRMGALAALAPDYGGAGAEAARLAAEIAGGKKPSEVQAARSRWNLVINVATAKVLGLQLPSDVLEKAVVVQ